MSTSKRSAIGASNLNTGRYTSPIIIKMILAFVVMTLLGAIIILFALVNLTHSNDAIKETLQVQENATRSSELRAMLINQQQEAEAVLFEGQDQEKFEGIRTYISNDINFNLVDTNLNLTELMTKENQFVILYHQFNEQPKDQRVQSRIVLEPQLEALTDGMVGLVDKYYDQFRRQTQSNLASLSQNQQDAVSTIFILILIALVVAGATIWFVLSSVVQPLRRMNEQLAQLLWSQNEHLTEQLNLLRQEINTNNEMLTTVRHDLKAPWSNVKSLAQLTVITHSHLPEDIQQNLQGIVEVSDNSVDTISTILARRETKLDLTPVQLNELVDKVLRLVDLRWFNITRKVQATEAVMDPTLMEHALLNLVSNARKFSGGGIGIGVNKIRKAGTVDEEELELWVWNDGTVITAGDREEIFKPGKQTAEGKKAGGHGLGLAIVKSIAERHHGRVTVESHEKKGTTFRIIIPMLAPEEAGSNPAQPLIEEEQMIQA